MNILDELIIELKRRIKKGFNDILVFEGDSEVWGKWQRQIPCVHLYELELKAEQVDSNSVYGLAKGKILTKIVIQLEFINKLTQPNTSYTQGREIRDLIRRAIELDERFAMKAKEVDAGQDLVVDYGLVASETRLLTNGVLDVAVAYGFRFVEPFYGYEKYRH